MNIGMIASARSGEDAIDHPPAADEHRKTNQHWNEQRHVRSPSLFVLAQ
jgi:hypothetical protein